MRISDIEKFKFLLTRRVIQMISGIEAEEVTLTLWSYCNTCVFVLNLAIIVYSFNVSLQIVTVLKHINFNIAYVNNRPKE